MTKEEAIENLKILKEDYWDDDGYGHETKQYDDTMLALDVAIEALEQEPWKPIKEIPKDYCYDTETKDFLVYRNKYTGHEIHIAHPTPQYRLEEESILDKIREEIEQNAYPIVHGVNNHELGMTLYGILQVIDKYKAESEDA